MLRKLSLMVLLATFGLGFAMGCEESGSNPTPPDAPDTSGVEDAAKDAAEDLKDKAEDAADKAEDAAEDAASKLGQ